MMKLSDSLGLITAATVSVLSPLVQAIEANPNPIVDIQPDGRVIEIRIKGDEHFHWQEDNQGYTIMQQQGWYKYAQQNSNGQLVASKHSVGKVDPKRLGLKKGLLPSASTRLAYAKTLAVKPSGGDSIVSNIEQNIAPVGTIKNLVVMIRFADHADRALPTTTQVDVLFNKPGGDVDLAPTGSVRDVYLQNSYGQFDLSSDVQAWVTVSNNESYYANGASGDSTLWQALREALAMIDENVDFSQYDSNNDGKIDAITFLHSGFGAEWGGTDEDGGATNDRIWSHRWAMGSSAWTSQEGVSVDDYHISPALWNTSGTQIGRIGVIAHETGHFFGLPDLYDINGGGAGIGSYGLMANSWDFEGSQYCPPHFSPWSKARLGWYTPQLIDTAGQYSLRQAETFADVYKVTQGFPSGEYLLIENRQNSGFDCTLPQGGLAIWHIDETTGHNNEGYPSQRRWPENGNHYQVALLQADGNYDLEQNNNRGDGGDVFHGHANDVLDVGPAGQPNTDSYQNGQINQTNNVISHISASSAVMTFCLNGCASNNALTAPSQLVAYVTVAGKGKNAFKSVELFWQDNADNEDQYIIERCQEVGKGNNKTCHYLPLANVAADIITFSDVPGAGTFKYRVKAINTTANSDYSNEVAL